MYIELEYLRFKNVLSYGATEIEHRFETGLTMISGRNGSGKSTFLEVLCYNWYGKPYRKITLEKLINRENKKGLLTETGIIVDKKDRYRIIRGMKPAVLKVFKNDQPFEMLSTKELNQEEITKILGIDYKMFKQIVSLAVTYNKPFLTQDAAEKREIVESIFNIKIFGEMLVELKEKIKNEKVKYAVNKKTVEILEENINLMRKNIIDIKKSIKEFEDNKIRDISIADGNIASIRKNIETLQADMAAISSEVDALSIKRIKMEGELDEKEKAMLAIGTSDDNPITSKLKSELEDINNKLDRIINAVKIESETPIEYDKDEIYASLLKKETELIVVTIPEYEKSLFGYLEGKPLREKIIHLNTEISGLTKLESYCEKEITDEMEYVEYLRNNAICKKCKAPITNEFKTQEIKNSESKVAIANENLFNAKNQITEFNKKIELINNVNTLLQDKKRELDKLTADKKARMRMLENDKETKILNCGTEKMTLTMQKSSTENLIEKTKNEKRVIADQEIAKLKSEIEKLKMIAANGINTMARHKQTIETNTNQINKFEETKKEVSERKSTFDLPKIESEFKAKITEFQTAYTENGVMAENLKVYDVVSGLLSEEGIKSFFFKRLTPILNAKINDYLDRFDIPVRVSFDEQMEENIYNVGNESEKISYYSYSEGEKKSIDIAILMSFIDITKVICSWNCNILMIDELIDGQVDFMRLEKMFECIREFSASGLIPSIYVISHRQIDEVAGFFKRIISVNKVNDFSELTVKKI